MNLIRASLERPVAVVSVVIMVLVFGFVALQTIPIQLIPDVRKPTLTIGTVWFGASPAEIEREIINRQEDALRGLEGVEQITSSAESGRSTVTLEFLVGQNIDRALILVSNRLQRVTGYPAEVQQPQIQTQGSDDNPIAWFYIRRLKDNTRPIHTYGDFVEDNVIDRMERVNGVSGTNFFGGSERELRVIVEPQKMARYGLTVSAIVDALRRANAFGSAGNVEEGKRSYLVRTEGELRTTNAVRAVLLRSVEDKATGRVSRVTVGDIATVAFGYKVPTATIRANGEPAVVFNVLRTTGANVIEVMRGIKSTLKEINENVLKPRGLVAVQVFDETVYINSAISLVQQNIFVGGTLAALILLLFLRSGRATLVVTLAIPVSVIGSFVAMAALGRSVNVISLAGIAFAVGMVVDAAIVVLENIFRLRERGLSRFDAAYEGARQVWGAVLVSALTTVMVFIPILILELEVGQLFRDIAVAISVAVLLSLVVAVTLIPALANRLLGRTVAEKTIDPKGAIDGGAKKAGAAVANGVKRLRLPIIDDLAELFVRVVLAFTRAVIGNRAIAFLVVAVVCGTAGTATWLLLPKLEYLPTGNRNLVIAIALPPPGYNLPTTTETARNIENSMRKHWAQVTGPKSKPGEPPKMARFFFVARDALTFIGASAVDESRARELIPVIRAEMRRDPGTFARVFQPSLFGRSIGGGRVINLDIAGPNLERNLQVALRAFILANQFLPRNQGNQFRPRPGLELGSPELRVLPNRVRLADAGVTARELTDTVDTYNQGLRVVEITVGGRRMDLTLMGPESKIKRIQGIGDIPVVTSSGTIVPVRSLAEVKLTAGAVEIRHLERTRTVTLEISPSPNIPLETAMDILRNKVIATLKKQGLPPGVTMGLSGEADQLTKTWNAMVWQLILAVVIVYLVMAVLFESFVFPFIIIFSVPLATAGGVLGLAVLNIFTRQSLDMLTLLGFVILIGTVVNNAILLVHQTLLHVREEAMEVGDAILEATRNRIRPIFMSTLTSVCGMTPLVIFPGAGSELYRGLGSVVLGGLLLSAILTLLIIPPLLSIIGSVVARPARGKAPAKGDGTGDPAPAPAE
ncbi:MAG TPA: efflux RND transporter permease subunit [Alphaproteobacteria bacterium]|nr:efflux RND transporter permease subunit [Alphaproteobacteria bacterium]